MTPSVIEDNATVLFQGDSITDADRQYGDDESLGAGYAALASRFFTTRYPEKNVRFLNRGINGNRACDLRRRWKKDCLTLKPTWVSIMIGVNDTWRAFDSNDPTGTEAYESDLTNILDQAKERLNAQIILCEPFLLPSIENYQAMRQDLDLRIEAIGRLAQKYQAILVPTDQLPKHSMKNLPHSGPPTGYTPPSPATP